MQPKSNIAAFFDFDETIIDINSSKVGFKWLYENKMLSIWFILKVFITGFLYELNLISEKRMADGMVIFYKGKKLSYFADRAEDFYHDLLKPHLVPKIVEKLKYHREQGHIVIIVSGSIRYYLEPVAKDLGIDYLVCTDLEEGYDGLLTGKPDGQICLGEYKQKMTQQIVKELNINLNESFAYGNSQADIHLLKMVGNPIAVEPNLPLKKVAEKNNWPILNYKL
jgi:HAD superfamily hydrolase (TIGR01490 family)